MVWQDIIEDHNKYLEKGREEDDLRGIKKKVDWRGQLNLILMVIYSFESLVLDVDDQKLVFLFIYLLFFV